MRSVVLPVVLGLGLALVPACDAGDEPDGDGDVDGGGDGGGPTMACGELACSIRTQYCYVVAAGAEGGQGTIECRALPEACRGLADPTCDCVDPGPAFACSCAENPEDSFLLHCSAP